MVTTEVRPKDELIVECVTRSQGGKWPKLRSISLDPPIVNKRGELIADTHSRFDAMFWSPAAVEKFVIPYYIRFNTIEYVNRIRNAFNRDEVEALTKLPWSDPAFLFNEGGALKILTLEEVEAMPGSADRS